MALIKTGTKMAIFQQNKSTNVKICQNLDKMVPSHLFVLNMIKLIFDTGKSSKWNVLELFFGL